ncbi:FadR/GntR family transcriptional regulator [Nocardioides sp. Soil796]|uniref:FadR/GntR family transcriptional regulator n=1 Tax=Nocardioides sp. Soil796 TaxID=1736412 RepID=UPI000A685F6A|nr:FCD domain-containing protein [Nocardioides sp. Soil796]
MTNDPGLTTPGPRRTGAPLITPVKVPKPAELFADMLREKIFSGEFPTGEALPPERTLVEQSQLSRATVREALGVLKQQGLLITRPGRTGGSIVSRPTTKDLVGSIDLYVQAQGWDSDTRTLVETREVVEPWCAAMAAERRSDSELDEMRHHNSAMEADLDHVERYLEASSAWHVAVATASHNPLLSALMHASRQAMITGTQASRFHRHEAREQSWQAHLAITEAIAAQDTAHAHELMGGHVRPGDGSVTDLLGG